MGCTADACAVLSEFSVCDVCNVFDVCVIAVCVGRVAISYLPFQPAEKHETGIVGLFVTISIPFFLLLNKPCSLQKIGSLDKR